MKIVPGKSDTSKQMKWPWCEGVAFVVFSSSIIVFIYLFDQDWNVYKILSLLLAIASGTVLGLIAYLNGDYIEPPGGGPIIR